MIKLYYCTNNCFKNNSLSYEYIFINVTFTIFGFHERPIISTYFNY